jgi:hypothetical protein
MKNIIVHKVESKANEANNMTNPANQRDIMSSQGIYLLPIGSKAVFNFNLTSYISYSQFVCKRRFLSYNLLAINCLVSTVIENFFSFFLNSFGDIEIHS